MSTSSDMTENIFLRFWRLARRNGGVSLHKALSLFPLILKGTVFYPFMLIERHLYAEKIKQHKMTTDPVFILGYYRSGTTFLQRVLALNNEWANITQLHTVIAECVISVSKPFLFLFQLWSKIFRMQNEYHKSEWDWNLVGEEDIGLTLLASEATCYWAFSFPSRAQQFFDRFSYFEGDNQADIKFWKDEYQALVHKYSFMFDGKQMLLKSPPNVAKIKELHELYPNAKFIFIHRNPYTVLKSVRRLWAINAKTSFQDNPTAEEIDSYTIKDFNSSMDRYYRDRGLVPEENLYEIQYEDFMKRPQEVLEGLWDKFQLKNRQIIPTMVHYVQKHDGEGVTKHNFAEKDYALAEDKLKKYIDLWGYKRP